MPSPSLHPVVAAVTQRIVQRSAPTRSVYLAQLAAMAARPAGAQRMGCANIAHAFAAMDAPDKRRASGLDAIGVVVQAGRARSAHRHRQCV